MRQVLDVVEGDYHLQLSVFGGTVNVWRCAAGNQVYLAGPDIAEVT